jgi:hypothetical protein
MLSHRNSTGRKHIIDRDGEHLFLFKKLACIPVRTRRNNEAAMAELVSTEPATATGPAAKRAKEDAASKTGTIMVK